MKNENTITYPKIVDQAEWQRARDALLVKEKAATRARDALAAERRRLPMVRIEKKYMFDGPMPVRGPIIRHARGHQTHLHVRFASPIAVENATRVASRAGKAGRNSGQLVALLSQNARPRATKAGKHTRFNARGAGHNSRRGGRGRVKAL